MVQFLHAFVLGVPLYYVIREYILKFLQYIIHALKKCQFTSVHTV